jgi:hypothetical protein
MKTGDTVLLKMYETKFLVFAQPFEFTNALHCELDESWFP